jgi:hypothetical protein
MDLLPEAHLYWANFDEYFTILAHVAEIDLSLVGYMIEKGYFAKLLDFYLVCIVSFFILVGLFSNVS